MALNWATMYAAADAAGRAAAEAAMPVPMVVAEADVLTGAKLAGGREWYVEGGCCGFAWITVRPGNSAFANWLKANGKARPDSYAGGVRISVSAYGQSMARKEAYASAFAEVLTGLGVKAYPGSRID